MVATKKKTSFKVSVSKLEDALAVLKNCYGKTNEAEAKAVEIKSGEKGIEIRGCDRHNEIKMIAGVDNLPVFEAIEVDGKKLEQTIKVCKTAEISFEIKDQLILSWNNKGKKSRVKLGLGALGMLNFEGTTQLEPLVVDEDLLTKALQFCLRGASSPKDNGLHIFKGVWLRISEEEGLNVWGTDSGKLLNNYLDSSFEYKGEPIDCIIPREFLESVASLPEDVAYSFALNDKTIKLETDSGHLFSALLEGNFPAIDSMIPAEYVFKASFSLDDFNEALAVVKLALKPASTDAYLTFKFDSNALTISSSDFENDSKVVLACESITGDSPFTIYIRYDYLVKAIAVTKSPILTFEFSSQEGLFLINRGLDEARTYMMPMNPKAIAK